MPWTVKQQRAARKRRTELGICISCDEPAVDGRTRCQYHLDLEAAKHRRNRARRRTQARCSWCGDVAAEGHSLCVRHLERDRKRKTYNFDSRAILMLTSYLKYDQQAGRPWDVAWNFRLRQVLALVPPEERTFWREIFRTRHIRNGFKRHYLEGLAKRARTPMD